MKAENAVRALDALRVQYARGIPFPHIAIDNFWPANELTAAVDSAGAIRPEAWMAADHYAQRFKRWIENPARLPAPLATILRAFNAPPMLAFLEQLTGIDGLTPDPAYIGGGLHRVRSGGRLEIHADFNLHPTTGLHRRLNALLYLNRDWLAEWNGALELWAPDMSRCVQQIEPVFNRLVVFTITDHAFHGHPHTLTCPRDRSRDALALYYYTKDRPMNEKAPFHWATWQQRP
jgi:hypothetical protein